MASVWVRGESLILVVFGISTYSENQLTILKGEGVLVTDLGGVNRGSHLVRRAAIRGEFDHVVIHTTEVSSRFG